MTINVDNPFFNVPSIDQTERYRAYIKIIVNGFDVTNNLLSHNYLISVLVKDGPIWEAHIELDDRDGKLDIPPYNATLSISMGWTSETSYQVFSGNIADVECGFGRTAGGRRMWIHGYGWQQGGAVKTPFQDHAGEGAPPGQMFGTPISFSSAASQFAGNAGMTVSVGPSFSGIVRDYWSMNNESNLEWFSRNADELGAMWRIENGTNIVFFGLNDFSKPNITATWGNNLLAYRVRPWIARSLWEGSKAQYYDHMLDQWLTTSLSGFPVPPGGWVNAIHSIPQPAPNAQVAQQWTEGDLRKASMYFGEGRITINGEPTASWGGTVTVVGGRPGVDGTYYIMCADQSWSRSGYVTVLEVVPNPATNTANLPPGPDIPGTATTANPVIVNNADGSVTTYYVDGSVSLQNALGTTTTNPDGSETFTPP